MCYIGCIDRSGQAEDRCKDAGTRRICLGQPEKVFLHTATFNYGNFEIPLLLPPVGADAFTTLPACKFPAKSGKKAAYRLTIGHKAPILKTDETPRAAQNMGGAPGVDFTMQKHRKKLSARGPGTAHMRKKLHVPRFCSFLGRVASA